MRRIAVVDLGTGNLHSVAKALEKVAPGARISVTAEHARISDATHVVLPGQGAIGFWLDALSGAGLRDVIASANAGKTAIDTARFNLAPASTSSEPSICPPPGSW